MDHFSESKIWFPYCQMQTAHPPLKVVGGEREFLILEDGRRLVDGISSWWTTCHGYNHPAIVDAIREQASRLAHVMLGGLVHQPAIDLADRLCQLVNMGPARVFYCDSGSVAVEVALKMAVQYWINLGQRGKTRFISFRDAYHGDTTGAMSVCDPVDSMHAHFKGFLLEQYPRPLPRDENEEAALDQFIEERVERIAGLIIEPLAQMAGGMRFHDSATLARIVRTARRRGLLVIADEVATGFGRTGTMFAMESIDDNADIVCVGKALTGGHVGMAATIANRNVYSVFDRPDPAAALMHGPTFMGNPIACAAALASLQLFQSEPVLEKVARIQSTLKRELEPLQAEPSVADVRVMGAIGAVQFADPVDVTAAVDFFVQRGCWIRPLRDVVYLAPPFNISAPSLAHLCRVVGEYACGHDAV